jgi:hypothetical protein
MFSLPWAPVALALTIVTQQAPPDASTITPIPSREAEATRATVAPVREPLAEPVPPRLVHRPRFGPLITGAVVFGVSYGLAVFFGYGYLLTNIDGPEDGGAQAWLLFIPLAGPLLAASNQESSDIPDLGWATYVGWSLAQVAGTALLIYGAVGHDVPRTRRQPRSAVGFAPVFSQTALGLALNATW